MDLVHRPRRLRRSAAVRALVRETTLHPNDLIYKNLMLARCVCRIGERALVTLDDIRRLQAADLRALEEAVFRLTYGESPDREVTCPDCKASITVPGSGVPPG